MGIIRPLLGRLGSWLEDADQQVHGVAAEDLLDVGRWEAAVVQQAGQVGELVIAGQDGAVVAVQVGADGDVIRADGLDEPEYLGAEVGPRTGW